MGKFNPNQIKQGDDEGFYDAIGWAILVVSCLGVVAVLQAKGQPA